MTATTLPAATATKLAALPIFSAVVLHTLLNELYAEPGFSDVEASDIAKALGTDKSSTAGAIARLVADQFVSLDHTDINGRKRTFLGSQLHDAAGTRDLAIAAIESRSDFCTPIAPKTKKATKSTTPEPAPRTKLDAKNARRRMRQYLATAAELSFYKTTDTPIDDADLAALVDRYHHLDIAVFGSSAD